MSLAVTTMVLGKRKAGPYTLHLESSSESESTSKAVKRPLIVNGKLVACSDKKYKCTYPGCEKSYSKPSRLEEHERSHSGIRPFVCEYCSRSYLREAHLQAHARCHRPDSERPFSCPHSDCAKRFWTFQHLQVHDNWHKGLKTFECTVEACSDAFSKQSQLREHIASAHSPPNTQPFICDHEGCDKSFASNQNLRAHKKGHDEKHYSCILGSCTQNSETFSTWSALQSHIRTLHPPQCTRPECKGKTFSSHKGLRAHQKLHDARDEEARLEAALVAETGEPAKKKRRGGDFGRDWKCSFGNCDKDFKSQKSFNTHVNVAHLGHRNHVCPHETCQHAFGYKHLLQRHLAKAHDAQPVATSSSSEEDNEDTGQDSHMDISFLTGATYARNAKQKLDQLIALKCPFPDLTGLLIGPSSSSQSSTCGYVFSRAYDLRRHMRAFHNVEIDKNDVDRWVQAKKSALDT